MTSLLRAGKTTLWYGLGLDAITRALKTTQLPGSNLKELVNKANAVKVDPEYPAHIDDAKLRFKAAMRHYNVGEADLKNKLKSAKFVFWYYALLSNLMIGSVLYLHTLFMFMYVVPIAVIVGFLTLSTALDHWRMRTKCFGKLSDFLRTPSEWMPS